MKKILKLTFWELIAENLNRNVIRDHIDNVDRGVSKKDADYENFIKIKDKLESIKKFINWKYKVDDFEVSK